MRKKQEDEVHEGAAWMTTYSDMVTLLFAFFVLMFAISSIDNEKFAIFIGSISPGGLTAEEFQAIREKYNPPDEHDDSFYPVVEDQPPDISDSTIITEPDDEDGEPPEEGEENDLAELEKMLGIYIRENNLGHIITLIEGAGDGDSLLIRLPGDALFDSGRAEVTPVMREVAEALAQLLSDIYDEDKPFKITVSGHTDNVPQNSAEYPDNWWLSSARANRFMRILRDESGIPDDRFSAQYHGETMPIGDNATEEGRRANRRVEVLISQQKRPQQAVDLSEVVESEESEESGESGESNNS